MPDDHAPHAEAAGVELDVPLLLLSEHAAAPAYAVAGDAGADLRITEDVTLAPHERALVGTGVAVAIPEGHAGFVHPRSGLAHRHGLSLVNAPGTIDAGYRGEIKLNLVNTDPRTTLRLLRGDRVAQLVVQPVVRARFVPVDALPDSARGAGGHGSTGGHTAGHTAGGPAGGQQDGAPAAAGDRPEGPDGPAGTTREGWD